ncbi:cytochrome P450, partial [Escherichia coli]|nr:cytochrome P450 [Escherichia coli]
MEMDKNEIEHSLLNIIVAGTDTTTYTQEWAMAELIHYPAIMSKVEKELEQVIGKGKPVEETDIGRLPYLQAVIKETFRLHPPVPLLLPRRAEVEVEIGGYTIPKDEQL